MRGALVIALCATGCFSDRGLAIEVDVGNTEATSVELFIGKEPCGSDTGPERCTAIEPPGARCALGDNTSWFRADVQRDMTNPQGRTATFRLMAATATPLPIIIAVGSNENGYVGTATLRDLVVPANTAQVVTTMLMPAQAVMPTQPPSPNENQDRVQVWTNKHTPQGTCVLVEHWKPNVAVQRDSVVPAEDPDCNDGVSTGNLPATPLCITPSSGSEPCMLGARVCAQDGTPGTMCAALAKPVCVPDQLCRCAGDLTCIQNNLEIPPLPMFPVLPAIDCTIPIDTSGIPCGGQPADINLNGMFHATCEQPLLAALMVPFSGFEQNASFNGLTVTLGPNVEQCKFNISSSGKLNGPADSKNFVIKLATQASALLLPIRFQLQPQTGTCSDQAMSCNPPQSDKNNVWACAH